MGEREGEAKEEKGRDREVEGEMDTHFVYAAFVHRPYVQLRSAPLSTLQVSVPLSIMHAMQA